MQVQETELVHISISMLMQSNVTPHALLHQFQIIHSLLFDYGQMYQTGRWGDYL